ncbi:MAG: hypothetical protein ACRD3A_15070 [Terriglobales bacterium]
MKEWSAMLGAEVESWPQVAKRPMFGFVVYYRRGKLFAALPRTRALGSPYAVLYKPKQPAASRSRKSDALMRGAGWRTFELASAADLKNALNRFDRAYRAAR